MRAISLIHIKHIAVIAKGTLKAAGKINCFLNISSFLVSVSHCENPSLKRKQKDGAWNSF